MAILGKPFKPIVPRKTPRISVNKLAEYLEASPTRRKRIVHDAKYPPKYQVTRYREARNIIKSFLTGAISEAEVIATIEKWGAIEEFDTEFQEQDNRLSIEALENMLDTETLALKEYDYEVYDDDNPLINIKGVDISVNPDILLRYEMEDRKYIGAIKLHISSSNKLSTESQKIVAVMIYNFIKEFHTDKKTEADETSCFSFDLFNKTIESCPTSRTHRMSAIEAACEEIALRWASL